jgi:hypothetical protein
MQFSDPGIIIIAIYVIDNLMVGKELGINGVMNYLKVMILKSKSNASFALR